MAAHDLKAETEGLFTHASMQREEAAPGSPDLVHADAALDEIKPTKDRLEQ